MMAFLAPLFWLIVCLSILITLHELGHYWVARLNGVRVMRFSFGFGKPLIKRVDKRGTEWVIAALPLGGYVSMLNEQTYEIPEGMRDEAFNNKSVYQRMAIVAAGPAMNLLLCVAFLWAMFLLGKPDFQPVIGQTQGLAAEAGLRAGDRLERIGSRDVTNWSDAALALTMAGMDRQTTPVQVRGEDGAQRQAQLPLAKLPAQLNERALPWQIGIIARHELSPPLIGSIQTGTPADGVLEIGDEVTAIDAMPVRYFNDISPMLAEIGRRDTDSTTEVMVEVQRDGQRLALLMRPEHRQDAERGDLWVLGIAPAPAAWPEFDAMRHYGVLAAVPAALRETWHLTTASVGMIGRMFSGRASVENVSGPVTIARYANASANSGPAQFLQFLALLSLSVCILNLLPIPLLDGGHLLYYLIELVKGSPVSEKAMVAGQYLGMAAVAGLMALAFYNDLSGLLR